MSNCWSWQYKAQILEELQEAKDDIRQLRDALKFYADPQNNDGGAIARRRLGATPHSLNPTVTEEI